MKKGARIDRKEVTKMKRRAMLIIVLPLLFLVLTAGQGFAQTPIKPPADTAKAEKETIKGTIDFSERLGGYFILGQEPGGEFFITNQNEKVLKKLKERGDTLIIQGHTTGTGAEFFFIETIDGKKYSGTKAVRKKATQK